jgi:hypothetical protein
MSQVLIARGFDVVTICDVETFADEMLRLRQIPKAAKLMKRLTTTVRMKAYNTKRTSSMARTSKLSKISVFSQASRHAAHFRSKMPPICCAA